VLQCPTVLYPSSTVVVHFGVWGGADYEVQAARVATRFEKEKLDCSAV
jgi:hypothetical protein